MIEVLKELEARGVEFVVGGCQMLSAEEIVDWFRDEPAFWCARFRCTKHEWGAYQEARNQGLPLSVRCRATTKKGNVCRNFVSTDVDDIEDWLPFYRNGVYCHVHGDGPL